MKEVVYRQLEKADYPVVQNLISDAFGLDQYVADEKILALVKKMYLYSCLAEKKYDQVAVYDGHITGVIMGASKQDKNKTAQLSILTNALKMAYYTMFIWFKTRNKKGGLNEVNRAYRTLIKGIETNFDGVLTLFAVKDTMRGLGIGKELLFKLNDYYSEHDTQRIYLYTDDTCNYGFYEHMGFDRLKTEQVTVKRSAQEKKMDVFLYGLSPTKLDQSS